MAGTYNNATMKNTKHQELKDLVSSMETDFVKFYEKGNHAAGTRIRKGMQILKGLASEIRIDIQKIKKA